MKNYLQKGSVSLAITKFWYFPRRHLKRETAYMLQNKEVTLLCELLCCFEYVRDLFEDDSASQEMEIDSILCIYFIGLFPYTDKGI